MTTKRVLVMGLSGTGKTTLSNMLTKDLDSEHINADEVRTKYNDWDFSREGRLRQIGRVSALADKSNKEYVILDLICPLREGRGLLNPFFTIWLDTEKESKYKDTDAVFEDPKDFDVRIETKQFDLKKLVKDIKDKGKHEE